MTERGFLCARSESPFGKAGTVADDIHALVVSRWNDQVQPSTGCPLYTGKAPPTAEVPYAVAEFVTTNVPLNAGRAMAVTEARFTVYARNDRLIETISSVIGLNTKVPTGFNRVDMGTDTTHATSVITGGGLIKTEDDPPVGGGKCSSRTIMARIRTGAK